MESQNKIFINLGGKSYHRFDSLRIEQYVNGHHRFEIVYRLNCFSKNTATFFEDTKFLIGKEVQIEIQVSDLKSHISTGYFRGLITEIASTKADHNSNGSVIYVRGYSPTILLEDGENCNDFINQDLKSIIRRTTTGYPENQLSVINRPRTKNTFPYVVQYNESNFGFLCRLASRYGEWFYFDGKDLVFGDNAQETSILVYGENLMEFELETKLCPQKSGQTAHNYWFDKNNEVQSNETYTTPGGITKYISDESVKFFFHTPKQHVIRPTLDSNTNQALREMAKLKKDGLMGNMVQINGMSTNPSLKTGHIVDIKGKNLHFGSYILTKVTHSASIDGTYNNIFEAIPYNQITPPYTNTGMFRSSGDQTAFVTDNNDPEGMGRVKIKFPWSPGLTPWIRMAIPYAGNNKGIFFIPENGEEVLVGFEGGDVEKPYVKGALYNGNHKTSWSTGNNDIKAIRTRSGHTIEFNDKDGKEYITINDKNGNSIHLDTVKGNVTVSAQETLTFTAKNIQFNVSENMETNVGQDARTTVREKLEITSKNSIESVSEEKEVRSGKKMQQISGEILIQSNSGEMIVDSKGKLTLQSNDRIDYGE